MQAQQMLLLARKYVHIYASFYASGIKALLGKPSTADQVFKVKNVTCS
jgi:hypothetical protein